MLEISSENVFKLNYPDEVFLLFTRNDDNK